MLVFQGRHARASLFHPGRRRLIVLFEHWDPARTGFEDVAPTRVFAEQGCSQLKVQTSRNDWYISSEIEALIRAIGPVSADYDDVINYGSSMGGFAAFLFSGATNAHRVVAVSPQYSIDRTLCPFETRWELEASALEIPGLRPECYGNGNARGHIFVDPVIRHDVEHARLLKNAFPQVTVRGLPGGGHPALHTMADAMIVGNFARMIASGDLTSEAAARLHAAARRQSPHYFMRLGERAQKKHPKLATYAYERVMELLPNRSGYKLEAASKLVELGAQEHVKTVMALGHRLQGRHPWLTKQAYESLVERLPDWSPHKLEAASKLVELGAQEHARTVLALGQRLRGRHPWLARQAYERLVKRRPDCPTKLEAAAQLVEIGALEHVKTVLATGLRLQARHPWLAEQAYKKIVELAPDNEPWMKFRAAIRLVELGDHAHIETLERILESTEAPPHDWKLLVKNLQLPEPVKLRLERLASGTHEVPRGGRGLLTHEVPRGGRGLLRSARAEAQAALANLLASATINRLRGFLAGQARQPGTARALRAAAPMDEPASLNQHPVQ